ncbi:unnamed protein product [Cylindrotheca closterium]|uniref:Uncharacterized protein n=1 Tax=Cylindrotheca closterium TaxID=2856 RepID=A0AAD2JJ16_9STRA|nr:unnamed protein product [Cylindrotheca closterium]
MNTQRRTFRGRGGPTDGRLPKHNARRAKRPKQPRESPKYSDTDTDNREEDEEYIIGATIVSGAEEDENEFQLKIVDPSNIQCTESSNENVLQQSQSVAATENESEVPHATNTPERNNVVPSDAIVDPTIISRCQKELKHLQRRIKNVRESMQLSQLIADPKKYEENILNAVANCVNEWRQIKKHYSSNDTKDNDEEELSEENIKEVSLNVFQLIQHSIQCGPLQGGKPGYFKRCGTQVAKVVLNYLLVIVPGQEASLALGFSEKQVNALESWKSNAAKAVANDKPPSKSQLKKQAEAGKTMKKSKKKK